MILSIIREQQLIVIWEYSNFYQFIDAEFRQQTVLVAKVIIIEIIMDNLSVFLHRH